MSGHAQKIRRLGARAATRTGRSPAAIALGMLNDWRLLVAGYAGLIVASSLVVWIVEDGYTLGEAFWWAAAVPLPVSYGGLTPATAAGHAAGLVLAYVAIWVVVPLIIAQVMGKLLDRRNEFTHEEQERIAANQDRLVATQEVLARRVEEQGEMLRRLAQERDAAQP